jgi:DNA-directed RNA polymerase specialized sigma24 family protein
MAMVNEVSAATSDVLVGLEPRLRRALVARYGIDLGSEVAADAIAWGVEHPDRLAEMQNPIGYLYRVGQSAARRHLRAGRLPLRFPAETYGGDAELPGDVFEELKRLQPDQRVAVLLVHGYGFTYREVAEMLSIRETAVTNHVHRGMKRLRRRLEGTR